MFLNTSNWLNTFQHFCQPNKPRHPPQVNTLTNKKTSLPAVVVELPSQMPLLGCQSKKSPSIIQPSGFQMPALKWLQQNPQKV